MSTTKDILFQPVTVIKGVGNVIEKKLNKLGIYVVRDIIFHLPIKYLDKTRITPLGDIRENTSILVQGEIIKSKVIFAKKRMLLVNISDNNGYINLRFFNFSEYQVDSMQVGKIIRCFGLVRKGNAGYEIIHPEYVIGTDKDVAETLTPVYPATAGVNQKMLQNISEKALQLLPSSDIFQEIFPNNILDKFSLMPIPESIKLLHNPTPNLIPEELESNTSPARYRLIFDELLAYQLSLLKSTSSSEDQIALPIKHNDSQTALFINKLPFSLTRAQLKVFQEILKDLDNESPMMRLVQGDVGCGKTIIAALAALQAVSGNLQVAIMAPTEILAEQHFSLFKKIFAMFDFNIMFLSGKCNKSAKKQAIENIKEGIAMIVIGTHAIFQEDVEFKKLGLIVIDEQHRFGVAQRLSLRNKSEKASIVPHQLVMSATPIPRTMAMAMYANLNISIVDEMPVGRKEVKTVVMSNEKRGEIIQKIVNVLKQGKQAYWVCPLIDSSEKLEHQAVTEIFEKLSSELVDFKVGMVHGRLKSIEKEAIISEFQQKKINLLVATTVVEVGVDVPNAVLMIIENAERLGLAQLHQLRGRVGRGDSLSYCILMYKVPLSENSRKRLEIIRKCNDGFAIAKQDLLLRGVGEIFGTSQTGANNMRVANLARDYKMLDKVRSLADYLLDKKPIVAQRVIDRWYDNKIKFIKA
ncbi:MAG: ATP-dependent DNA helicase RecG [Legionellales bacterium]|nr:ATP-dependent DNA helicase RecG [Legionellales bacterium]